VGKLEIAALAGWLREYNTSLPADKKVGFYGLDVYSLWGLYEKHAAIPGKRRQAGGTKK